jgi:hypothetical protein
MGRVLKVLPRTLRAAIHGDWVFTSGCLAPQSTWSVELGGIELRHQAPTARHGASGWRLTEHTAEERRDHCRESNHLAPLGCHG